MNSAHSKYVSTLEAIDLPSCIRKTGSRVVVHLHICLDESGKPQGHQVAICGWASTVPRWQAFGGDWFPFLGENGITSLHTADLMSCSVPYQGLNFTRDERLEVLKNSLELVRKFALGAIAVSVDCRVFDQMTLGSRKKCGGNAHVFCFRQAVRLIVSILDEVSARLREPAECSLIFDDNEEHALECYRLLSREKSNNSKWRKSLRSICFCDDEAYPPLQLADVLSWLTRHYVSEDPIRSVDHFKKREIFDLIDLGTKGLIRGSLVYSGDALGSIDKGLQNGKTLDELSPISWYDERERPVV